GMGEPFLNYANAIKAGKTLNNAAGLNIAARKLVYSTVGIVPGIKKFAEESEQLRFSWSLASPFDTMRENLIPFPGLKSIKETVEAIKEYQLKTRRRVTIEYVLLKGINDSEEDIKELGRIAKSIDSHINLIAYNSSPTSVFESGDCQAAFDILRKKKLVVTVRRSYGQKIAAACGQLAGS
ncbi:MAG: 23S rRNA (adenine(2503)-C(2))-methyltransferase RlmN, partial [bacterium]